MVFPDRQKKAYQVFTRVCLGLDNPNYVFLYAPTHPRCNFWLIMCKLLVCLLCVVYAGEINNNSPRLMAHNLFPKVYSSDTTWRFDH